MGRGNRYMRPIIATLCNLRATVMFNFGALEAGYNWAGDN